MPYEKLFCNKTSVVPGTIRCDRGFSGLQIQVVRHLFENDAGESVVEIRIGGDHNESLYIDKKHAMILRDFFEELSTVF